MSLQPITYRGQILAAAGPSRFLLSDELLDRPAGDPELTFLLYMTAYARDVLRGELPGPYSDEQARHYARAAMIPDELLERAQLDVAGAARALGVPIEELAQAAREHQPGRRMPRSPREDPARPYEPLVIPAESRF